VGDFRSKIRVKAGKWSIWARLTVSVRMLNEANDVTNDLESVFRIGDDGSLAGDSNGDDDVSVLSGEPRSLVLE